MPSFLDELRAEREVVLANSTFDVPVPPSATRVVRCRAPEDSARLDEIVAVYRVGGALSQEQTLQLMVDVCQEILARDPKTGEVGPFDDDGGPLRFDASDPRWGEEVKTARDCVRVLYNLDVHPLALSGTVERIVDWLQGVADEGLERVEGKSEGAEVS